MSLICYVFSRPFFQVQPFTEDFWDTVCFLRQRLRLYIHICFNVGHLFIGFSYPSSQYHALFLLFFPSVPLATVIQIPSQFLSSGTLKEVITFLLQPPKNLQKPEWF